MLDKGEHGCKFPKNVLGEIPGLKVYYDGSSQPAVSHVGLLYILDLLQNSHEINANNKTQAKLDKLGEYEDTIKVESVAQSTFNLAILYALTGNIEANFKLAPSDELTEILSFVYFAQNSTYILTVVACLF